MRRILCGLLVPALIFGAVSCSKQSGAGSGGETGTLRIGLPITPTNLNALLSQNTNEVFVDGLIYSQLVTIDDKGNDVPDLASVVPSVANGGVSNDGKTLTYHLRSGVKWHDGAAFTSKDVAFTWRALMNPANDVVARHGYDLISSVSTPDPLTVVFHMKTAFAPAIDTLFGPSDSPYFILPEHLLGKYKNMNQIPFNAAPIGTGPFKFARWLRGDQIILTANVDYFVAKPKLSKIVIKLIPDANTTEAELRGHDIDLAFELTGTNYRNFAGDANFVRTLAKAPTFTAIMFNTSRAPLTDVRVRRALVLGIDRPTIAAKDTYGTGDLATADLSTFYWAFDRSLVPPPYDPKAAGALLDTAGWRLGADGMRHKNGAALTLQLTYGNGSQLVRNIVAQVQSELKGIGVDVTTKGYDYSVLYAAAQSGGIFNSGTYDIAMYSWTSGADPDNSSQWRSDNLPPNGNDVTRYKSAAMDAAQKDALSSFDRATRKQAYARIEKLLLEDAPAAFIYYQGERMVATPAFTGFAPNGIDAGWNSYAWSI